MSAGQPVKSVDQVQVYSPSSGISRPPIEDTDEGSQSEVIPSVVVEEDHPSSLRPPVVAAIKEDGTGILSSEEVLQRAKERIKNASPELWSTYLRASTVTLLVGEASAGKTVLLYNLAYYLATGQEFLGFKSPRPLNVLSVDFEGNDEIRAMNLTAVGTAPNWGFLIPQEDLFGIAQEDRGQEVIRRLGIAIRTRRYDLIIVDSLIEAYPVEEENSNDQANKQMVAFRQLANSTGVGVVLVHNTGLKKNNGKNSQKKGLARGASSRVDRADIVLNYTVEGPVERQITVVKSRGNNLGEWIRVRFSGELGYEVIASPAAVHSVIEKLQTDSVRVVQEESNQGRTEVKRKTIMDVLRIAEGSAESQALDRALGKNVLIGALLRPKKGVYSLPLAIASDEVLLMQEALEPLPNEQAVAV